MRRPDLLGAKVKIHRAHELLDVLQDKVLTTIGFAAPNNAVATKHGFNEQMTEYGLWIEAVPRIEMLMFGTMIGEIVHDLRSALDHLAWELVDSVGDISLVRTPRDVQFPIYSSPGGFQGNIERRLPGVPSDYIAVIEGLQPYNGKHLRDFESHNVALGRLAALSNRDKHQVITPILAAGTYIPWFEPNEDLSIHDRIVDEGPLQQDAYIVRHFVQVTGPNPHMKVKGQASFDIAFEDGKMVSVELIRMWAGVRRVRTLIKRIAFPTFP